VLKTALVLIQINTADLVASWRSLLDQPGTGQQARCDVPSATTPPNLPAIT
jgi:hypothetical protein